MFMKFDKELDVRGLNCPLPILKTKKILSTMLSNEVLRVLTTDYGSVRDFGAFAKQTGNHLLKQVTEDKNFIFFLRRR